MPADTPSNTVTAGPTAPGHVAPVAELLSGIVGDVQTLVRQQAQMVRAEVKQDISRGAKAGVYVGAGVVLALIGVLFLVIGLVYLLQYLTGFEAFVCWFIVGGLLVAGGLAAAYAGKKLFDKFNPIPEKSIHALTENLSWQTTPSPK